MNFVTRLYVDFREYAVQKPWLFRLARISRLIIMVGPWRSLVVKFYQYFDNNTPIPMNTLPFFSVLERDHVVRNIEQRGFSMGLTLSEKYVKQLVKCYENTQVKVHVNPHKTNTLIFQIACNVRIIEVARQYLGVEPILHGSAITWSYPSFDSRGRRKVPTHHTFHYDVSDFKALNAFIYLTDTDEHCGPHVVIENTHQQKSLPQLLNNRITDKQAHDLYGDRVKIITGAKGTGFFEETTSFHKQLLDEQPRLLLTLEYTLRRQPTE